MNKIDMKKAHEMTKKIKKEYPNVDYKLQLGLCMKELYIILNESSLGQRLDDALNAIAEKRDVRPSWNKWEKYGKRRLYYSWTGFVGKWRCEVKCGYLDLDTNEYITKDRSNEIYNLLTNEFC